MSALKVSHKLKKRINLALDDAILVSSVKYVPVFLERPTDTYKQNEIETLNMIKDTILNARKRVMAILDAAQ